MACVCARALVECHYVFLLVFLLLAFQMMKETNRQLRIGKMLRPIGVWLVGWVAGWLVCRCESLVGSMRYREFNIVEKDIKLRLN